MNNQPIAIVTGSSRGIGAAIAKTLARSGYFVGINYHQNHTAATRVLKDIQQAGGDGITIQADVSQPDDVNQLFNTIDQLPGTLSALVNNAGILSQHMRLDQMDDTRWEHAFRQNVISAFLCSKQAVLRMSTRYGGHGGTIVNVSSASSYLGSANEYIDYAATKGAMDSMTRGLAMETAGEGIRVNAVRPALIETDIHATGGMPDRVQQKQSIIPLKRGGKPDDVANAVLFLMTDQSSFITGTCIDVSGGL